LLVRLARKAGYFSRGWAAATNELPPPAGLADCDTPVVVDRCDPRRRPGNGFDEFRALFAAQDRDGGVEPVAGDAVARDGGNADAVREAEPGARVDNVRVAFAVDLDDAVGVAGGGDRGVGEVDVFAGRLAWRGERLDRDAPAALRRGRAEHAEVAAFVDERAMDAGAFQRAQRLVDDVPAREAGDVEPHARGEQLNGPIFRIEFDVAISDGLARGFDAARRGKLLQVARPPPESCERADGHVERAVCEARHFDGSLQDVKQLRAHDHRLRHWPVGSLPGKPADLARRVVVAQDFVQAIDARVSRSRSSVGLRLVPRVEEDPKSRPHLRFVELEPLERGLASRDQEHR
jgi:hypothetical protein